MNKTTSFIGGVLLLVVLITGSYALYNKLSQEFSTDDLLTQNLTQIQNDASLQATDFTVYDEQGNRYKLSDFRGKPVVLSFWATWCSICVNEMPTFDAMYEQYKDDVHFLMVNLTDGYQETFEEATSFIKNSSYKLPVYYDVSSEAAIAYGVMSIPVTYFIDKDGRIDTYHSGAITKERFNAVIGELL